MPAKVLKDCEPWTIECQEDVETCEKLRLKMGLEYLCKKNRYGCSYLFVCKRPSYSEDEY